MNRPMDRPRKGRAGGQNAAPYSPSLRRRLVTQLLGLSAILAIALFFAVRISSEQASEATLDGILGAATIAIAEELRSVDGGPLVELPSGTFSILSAMGEERIFYRIMIGGRDLTGYEDLPAPAKAPSSLEPVFYTALYRDAELRIAAVARNLVIDEGPVRLLVMVGQTREAQNAIAARLANRAAALGLAVFLAAIPLSLLAASRLLRPIEKLAAAMERRGPRDLRPVRHPAPAELVPLISALNSFITRLRGTLAQTETFIAEAAHHIRTPLATIRSEAELALRLASDEAMRQRMRGLIRAVDEGSRSTGQLLDHATVAYRAGQQSFSEVDLGRVTAALAERYRTAADLKDIHIRLSCPEEPLTTFGDAVLLEAAIRNLIDNAIKYSPPDTDIHLTLQRKNEMAELTCRDHGRGLDGQSGGTLSGRFQRGTNVDDVIGSGLGLTIVSEAAAVMEGRFSLEAAEGGGALATLQLPLLAQQEERS